MIALLFYTIIRVLYCINMKVDIFIPENLSEITLGQYQKFLGVSEGKDLDLFVQQKMIEIFCKIDLKDVANIKYNDLQDTLVHFNDLFNDDYKLHRFFKMGSTEFGLIPKLDDMTFGEYVTLDTYMGDWKNMDKAMEVLFRPVKIKSLNKYDIEEYEPEKFDMSKMPLSAALGALVFFYRLNSELQKTTLNYLMKETAKTTAQKQISQPNGDGINQSMDLVAEIFKSSILLRTPMFTSA